MESLYSLTLETLRPHPQNPRFAPREDVVAQIAAQLIQTQTFDPAHALIVRPVDGHYEIIAGHHRVLAAQQAGLTEVPCWVREMSDEEAYMALVLDNAQSELLPLEEGMHALRSGLHGINGSEYARQVGKPQQTVAYRIQAARVVDAVTSREVTLIQCAECWRQLAEIHAVPGWLWPELVATVFENPKNPLTVEKTREIVRPLKDIKAPPSWSDQGEIAGLLVAGKLRPKEVTEFTTIVEACVARLTQNGEDAERLITRLYEQLTTYAHSRPSDVSSTCLAIEEEQRALMREREQQDLFRRKRDEEIRARTARLRRNVSLDEWQTLATDEQQALLHLGLDDGEHVGFNKQESAAIEWAQYSWNPVTGCLHNCPYCYARDIAEDPRKRSAFPNLFAPTFRPLTVLAPRHMAVPAEAATDARFRNVFTCSMADLFGRWVPPEWIEAVFREMHAAPHWNFLCLTKFPKRLREFKIPPNAWMGTTVDLQARVKAAEDAFAHITTGIRWLSIEPLLEPLRFRHLERFDWMVIGGASRSTQTPEWRPPHAWIKDLERQADDAGVKVYYKTNLLGKRRLELPFNAVLPDESEGAEAVFHYLKTSGSANGLE